MSTEDDTFRKLRKPSIAQMIVMVERWKKENPDKNPDEFVKQYDWTWFEFVMETARFNIGR